MEKGKVWDWAIPLWSCSLDPVCMAGSGLTHTVPRFLLCKQTGFFPAQPSVFLPH